MKLKLKIFVFVFCLVFLIGLVNAEQPTQQSNKIFLNPFYTQSMTSGVNTSFSVNVNPPDKISSVLSAIISFDIYITPTVTFNLWVNNKSCNNPTYVISTTFASAGQSRVTFDCSNVIDKAGSYTVTLKPTQANTGAVSGWLDLTYMNNPSGEITLGGTEYTTQTNGKLWLQLLDSNKNSVNNAVCYLDIFSPTGTSFLTRATMTSQSSDGLYYYNLQTPNTNGVYPAVALCYYVATQNPRKANKVFIYDGTVTGGTTLGNTNISDGTYYQLTTDKSPVVVANNHVNVTMNFTDFYSICGNVSSVLITGMTIFWQGIWNSGQTNHNVIEYLWNYTSGSWITMPNTILEGNAGSEFSVSNSLAMTNFTNGLGISSTNPVQVRFTDTESGEGAGKHFYTDYLFVSCDQLGNASYQQVQGSSEMHVSSSSSSYQDYIPSTTSIISSNTQNFNGSSTYYTGFFIANFTIASTVPNEVINDTIIYTPFDVLPCNAIQGLISVNSTGSYTNLPFTTDQDSLSGDCQLTFLQTLEPSANYNYVVWARNVWESDLRSTNNVENLIYPQLSSTCDYWAIVNGLSPYPYVVPANQTYPNSDYLYMTCSSFFDNYYYFNQTYNLALTLRPNINNLIDYQQYESDYFSAKFAEDKLNTISSLATDYVTSTAVYSEAFLLNPINAPNLNITQFFANISTTQIILNGLQSSSINYSKISDNVWNASNRSLTLYLNSSLTVNVNSTDIANAVWNYSGNVSTNIITQIWNFAGSISSNILTQISDAIWNHSDRNLTFYPNISTQIVNVQNVTNNITTQVVNVQNVSVNSSVDYNNVAGSVWNFSGRYTHGVISI